MSERQEPRGAQQRLSGGRQAGGTVVPRVLLCPPAAGASGSFIIAGSGEAEEGHASYRERTVRFGDTSPAGLREKAVLRAGSHGAAHGRTGCHVVRHDGGAGLYGVLTCIRFFRTRLFGEARPGTG